MMAALYAEKVRVNPGNYIDPARVFKKIEYTDAEYAEELRKLEARFIPSSTSAAGTTRRYASA